MRSGSCPARRYGRPSSLNETTECGLTQEGGDTIAHAGMRALDRPVRAAEGRDDIRGSGSRGPASTPRAPRSERDRGDRDRPGRRSNVYRLAPPAERDREPEAVSAVDLVAHRQGTPA